MMLKDRIIEYLTMIDNSEHLKYYYYAIYGKELYLCADNPLEKLKRDKMPQFKSRITIKGKYDMVR